MEGLSSALGLFPLMAGMMCRLAKKYITAIKLGTDPKSPSGQSETGPYDQRLLMAAYGLGLALMQDQLTHLFSESELTNLHRWLNQITDAQMPDSNWNYFAIIVQLGLNVPGCLYDQAIDRRFEMMEAYYARYGWYPTAPDARRITTSLMHSIFYGLIYATLNANDDPARAATLRERSCLFAKDLFISAPPMARR